MARAPIPALEEGAELPRGACSTPPWPAAEAAAPCLAMGRCQASPSRGGAPGSGRRREQRGGGAPGSDRRRSLRAAEGHGRRDAGPPSSMDGGERGGLDGADGWRGLDAATGERRARVPPGLATDGARAWDGRSSGEGCAGEGCRRRPATWGQASRGELGRRPARASASSRGELCRRPAWASPASRPQGGREEKGAGGGGAPAGGRRRGGGVPAGGAGEENERERAGGEREDADGVKKYLISGPVCW